MPVWRNRATICHDALHHNIATIRDFCPEQSLMAVVKADAYGHGIENVVPAIANTVDGFAVATVNEGIACRDLLQKCQVVSDCPIVLVLSEFNEPNQLAHFATHQLELVVHAPHQIEWLESYTGSPLSVWLKVETGMHRLGLATSEIPDVIKQLSENSSINRIRLISHLANADNPDSAMNQEQELLFRQLTVLGLDMSLVNSGGVCAGQTDQFQWVRPGLAVYGINPIRQELDKTLRPVMTFEARLIACKTIEVGQSVGYGEDYIATRKSRIGTLAVGYGDGYPRLAHPQACVLLSGKRLPLVGRVSMDMLAVDLTDAPQVNIGDVARLWGPGLDVSEVAQWAGTIPYDLLCRVSKRVPRIVRN